MTSNTDSAIAVGPHQTSDKLASQAPTRFISLSRPSFDGPQYRTADRDWIAVVSHQQTENQSLMERNCTPDKSGTKFFTGRRLPGRRRRFDWDGRRRSVPALTFVAANASGDLPLPIRARLPRSGQPGHRPFRHHHDEMRAVFRRGMQIGVEIPARNRDAIQGRDR